MDLLECVKCRMDDHQNRSVNADGEFAPWLEQILPRRRALRYIRSRGGHLWAEDICQDVSTKLAKQYENGKDITASYVFTSLRNMVTDYHRRKKARERAEEKRARKQEEIKQKEPLKGLIEELRQERQENRLYTRVVRHIDKLDLKQRVILKLRTNRGYKFTFAQIADIIGYSESAVRIKYRQLETDIMKLIHESRQE